MHLLLLRLPVTYFRAYSFPLASTYCFHSYSQLPNLTRLLYHVNSHVLMFTLSHAHFLIQSSVSSLTLNFPNLIRLLYHVNSHALMFILSHAHFLTQSSLNFQAHSRLFKPHTLALSR